MIAFTGSCSALRDESTSVEAAHTMQAQCSAAYSALETLSSLPKALDYSLAPLQKTQYMLLCLFPLYLSSIQTIDNRLRAAAKSGTSRFFCDLQGLRQFCRDDAEALALLSEDLLRIGAEIVFVNVTPTIKAILHACRVNFRCAVATAEHLALLNSFLSSRQRLDVIGLQIGRSLDKVLMVSSGGDTPNQGAQTRPAINRSATCDKNTYVHKGWPRALAQWFR